MHASNSIDIMNIFSAIKKNIPNTITCLNLLCGSIACIMALRFDEQVWWGIDAYQAAFIMIALAALFDFFDGLVARLLNVVSAIGKELDSLCDCVSFGLAPGLLVYAAMNHADPDSALCYAALLIPVLGAVRLANFNVDTRQTTSFIGMPIPANAIFWIGFISWYANNTFLNPWFVVALIVVMSLLMVSSIPMFSLKLKNFNFKENYKVYFLVFAFFLFVFTSHLPGLSWTIIFYVLASALVKD